MEDPSCSQSVQVLMKSKGPSKWRSRENTRSSPFMPWTRQTFIKFGSFIKRDRMRLSTSKYCHMHQNTQINMAVRRKRDRGKMPDTPRRSPTQPRPPLQHTCGASRMPCRLRHHLRSHRRTDLQGTERVLLADLKHRSRREINRKLSHISFFRHFSTTALIEFLTPSSAEFIFSFSTAYSNFLLAFSENLRISQK